MPIRNTIWKVGAQPQLLKEARLPSEQMLEQMIVADPGILSDEWMLIGQQVATNHGGFIDLLAITPDGGLVVIELKRDRTPRDVVAQALDYASWADKLESADIAGIYGRFRPNGNLAYDFHTRFGQTLDEDAINENHQIVIVAASLDASTERIVDYLNGWEVPVNVVFFQVFDTDDTQLLSRTWLIDPGETQINASAGSRTEREPWNGEFYVSSASRTIRVTGWKPGATASSAAAVAPGTAIHCHRCPLVTVSGQKSPAPALSAWVA